VLQAIGLRLLGREGDEGWKAAIIFACGNASGLARHGLVAVGTVLQVAAFDMGSRFRGDSLPRIDVRGPCRNFLSVLLIELGVHSTPGTAGPDFVPIELQEVNSDRVHRSVAKGAQAGCFLCLFVAISDNAGDPDGEQRGGHNQDRARFDGVNDAPITNFTQSLKDK
jgi:hypothetical protein